MNKACIESFWNKFRQLLVSLKNRVVKVASEKPRMVGLIAGVLVLVLALCLVFSTCSREEPVVEPTDAALEVETEATQPSTEPPVVETQPVGIPATMGTIITDQLSICKDAGFVVDIEEYYAAGDRVEIHETKSVNGVEWGYTGKGWINMVSVRMDDVPPAGENSTEMVTNGSYAVLGYGVVDLQTLNVRVGPGTDYTKVKEISQGVRYAFYEEFDGWVRIDGGWVSTQYFYVEGTTAEDATAATVTTNDLNIRTGPDTTFQRLGSYMDGDPVQLLAVVNGWGYTEKGWISMIYVKLPEPVYATGNATVATGLNIREEPNADSAKLDVYKEGDQVVILEVKDGWGRTDKGWINLDYVKYD